MKCFYHQENEAVATCQVCGKFLCKECSEKYSGESDMIICQDCFEQQEKYKKEALVSSYNIERKRFIKHIIIGVVLAIIGASEIGAWGCLAFFLAFGWFKNNKTEEEKNRDAILSSGNGAGGYLIGTILGFLFKLVLCAFLGIPLFIRDTVQLVKMSQSMETE